MGVLEVGGRIKARESKADGGSKSGKKKEEKKSERDEKWAIQAGEERKV